MHRLKISLVPRTSPILIRSVVGFQCVGVCVWVCVCVCVWVWVWVGVWIWYDYFNINPLLFLPSVAGTSAPPTTMPSEPSQRQQGVCWQITPNFSGQSFIRYVKQLPMTLWYFSNATALAILST